jgi:hypothetical protein
LIESDDEATDKGDDKQSLSSTNSIGIAPSVLNYSIKMTYLESKCIIMTVNAGLTDILPDGRYITTDEDKKNLISHIYIPEDKTLVIRI